MFKGGRTGHDRNQGLYDKFVVRRTDGTDGPGGKHADCEYFVLDLTHDPFARAALVSYAEACRKEFPSLYRDLRTLLDAS